MPKKKLLFIAPTTDMLAGGEISNFELLLDAQKRGYHLHIIIRGPGSLARELKKNSIPYSIVPFGNWAINSPATSRDNISAIVHIQNIIQKEKIDCVISNTLNMPWGALAAALTNVPHVWIAREFSLIEFSYLQDKYDFIQKFSNLLIANSQSLANDIKKKYQINTKYFYSYVNVTPNQLIKKASVSRIVTVGHLYPRKNQIDLIKAVGLLHKKGKLQNKVLFIGSIDKSYQKELVHLSKKLNLKKYIEFAGYHKNPYKLISENDIIVQPSLSESIGRSTVEAMKLGLITIGADIPGTKEAFQLGGGILYKNGDSQDLAKKIDEVLNNKQKFRKQALLVQKNALANLSSVSCHKNFFL
jgi:glycosyltransferase involved in cell wall biosynthesis